jgi:predicted nucleotidyltransferase
MESRNILENWTNVESAQSQYVPARAETKHVQILGELLEEAKSDPNTLGYMVFGSVASGTHNEKSDLDVITILRSCKPSSGINKIVVDGLVVDSLFMTHDVLTRSVNTVPYLLQPLGKAKLLFDRENAIKPLLARINDFFAENPEIESEWNDYIKHSNEVKLKTGCRVGSHGNTIIDVWNELEKRYSDGKIKRPFFNSFYLTNPHIFSLVKRFLKIKEGGDR